MAADSPAIGREVFDEAFALPRTERLARMMDEGLPDGVHPYSFITGKPEWLTREARGDRGRRR